MEYIVELALESDYEAILKKINLYFDKGPFYFQNLVPVLYKEGTNSYENHLVVKYNKEIIGIIAIRLNYINILDKRYSFLELGTLCVDHNYRNQGIMGLFFDYILNKYDSVVDFYCLSGNFNRYQRFGFYPSAKIYKYLINFSEYGNCDFVSVDEKYCEDLYNKLNYRVDRVKFIDSLNMWTYKPYMIIKDGKKLGYLIYNANYNLVEEIVLEDESLVKDVLLSFSNFIEDDIYLKVSINNQYLEKYLLGFKREEYIERTLYRIINESIKEIYIPRSDII